MNLIITMLSLLIGAVTASGQPSSISICSFTISELGATRENKDHRAIADLIDDYHLIAIQEVQDNGGAEHIRAIVDSMNAGRAETDKFQYTVLPSAGRGFPGNEGYALIFRSPVFVHPLVDPPMGIKNTDVPYGRKPGWAYFEAGNFDFLLVIVHLHWSDLEKRQAEAGDLLRWLKQYADIPVDSEKDLIMVGNFDRFGNYSSAKITNRETAFHQFLDDYGLNDQYRLLFCEYLPSYDTKESPRRCRLHNRV